MNFFVEVIDYKTNEVVKTIPCTSERNAEKVQSGLDMNLDHEKFFTEVKQK